MKSPSFSWPVAARIWRPSCGEEMPPLTLILKPGREVLQSIAGGFGSVFHGARKKPPAGRLRKAVTVPVIIRRAK